MRLLDHLFIRVGSLKQGFPPFLIATILGYQTMRIEVDLQPLVIGDFMQTWQVEFRTKVCRTFLCGRLFGS